MSKNIYIGAYIKYKYIIYHLYYYKLLYIYIFIYIKENKKNIFKKNNRTNSLYDVDGIDKKKENNVFLHIRNNRKTVYPYF